MNASTIDWRNELNNMLSAFDHQARLSLNNIRTAFKFNGLLLNEEFKQYFLRVSNDRIKLTYDQFERNAMFQDQIAFGAHENMPIIGSQMFNSITEGYYMTDPDEIVDTSDDYDGTVDRIKVESSETTSLFQFDNIRIKSELNDFVQSDDEGSCVEVPNFNEEMEIGNGISMNVVSTVTLNSESNIADGTEPNQEAFAIGNKKTGRGPRAETKSGAFRKKMSINQAEMKKRFMCQICDYSSNYKGNLDKHMRTHTGEKPYQCEICRKKYSHIQSLTKHKASHIDEFPFHCRGCFNGFSQKAEKDAHESFCKIHPYECYICKKYVTLNKTMMKIHMRTHSGEKPFRCEICMMRFTVKCTLKSHLNTIHTRINP